MKIIVVTNQKGGVGRTTTAVNLAHGLALRSRRVLLIDLDPRGHCALALGSEPQPGVYRLLGANQPLRDVLRPSGRPYLVLLPSDKRTRTAQIVLLSEGRLSRGLWLNVLWPLAWRDLDYCVIDATHVLSALQEAALYAADVLIIPASCDYLSIEPVGEMLDMFQTINSEGSTCQLLGILPTFYDDQTRESKTILAQLSADFGEYGILPPIHRATVFRECPARGKTIFEYAPESRAAREYADLATRVEDLCSKFETNREKAMRLGSAASYRKDITDRLRRITGTLADPSAQRTAPLGLPTTTPLRTGDK